MIKDYDVFDRFDLFGGGAGGKRNLLFRAVFGDNPSLSSDATFTRASTATVTDFEGVVKHCKDGEARFTGRRVENLVTGLVTETITVIVGKEYQATMAGNNGDTVVFSGAFTGTLTADGTNRISFANGLPKTAITTSLTITVTGSLTDLQVEDVSGQANQNPSEYVSVGVETAPYHGAAVDGVKYFAYENANTVTDGVVTEATGAPIPNTGYLHEGARTNLTTSSQEFDNAAWGKASLTVTANTDVAPDGSTTADLLTTSVNNHFIADSITVTASTEYVFSFYVLRGTMVDVKYSVYDNTNAANIIAPTSYYSQTSSTDWVRISIPFTTPVGCVSAAIYPLRDSGVTGTVYLWGAQLEQAETLSTYIPTLGTTATRAVDALNYPLANNFDETQGMLIFDVTMNYDSYVLGTSESIISTDAAIGSTALLSTSSATSGKIATNDSANFLSNTTSTWSANDRLVIGITWSGTSMKIGRSVNGVWEAWASGTFDGAYAITSLLEFFKGTSDAHTLHNAIIYDEDKGTDWIEAKY